jgi:hypothetical protein
MGESPRFGGRREREGEMEIDRQRRESLGGGGGTIGRGWLFQPVQLLMRWQTCAPGSRFSIERGY